MKKKDKRVWRKGPPPHIGWWNASAGRHRDLWRWWNGSVWSICLGSGRGARDARDCAALPSRILLGLIEWTDYWPENARVPRVKP